VATYTRQYGLYTVGIEEFGWPDTGGGLNVTVTHPRLGIVKGVINFPAGITAEERQEINFIEMCRLRARLDARAHVTPDIC